MDVPVTPSSSVKRKRSSCYSVSFQENYTEVTPLVLQDGLDDLRRHSAYSSDGSVPVPNNERQGASFRSSSVPSPSSDSVFDHSNTPGRYSRLKATVYGSDNPSKYDTVTPSRTGSLVLCLHGNEMGKCCSPNHITIPMDKETSNGSVTTSEEHCHTKRSVPEDATARKRLITASVLCLVFMIAEVIGGYLAGSLAIMTDAAHLLTDFASFMISLFALWMATRPRSKKMSFGWHRAEVIGALTSVLLIWVVTGILVYLAIERIVSQKYEIEADIMLITSGAGVGVNILMGLVLHCQGGGGHTHGGMSHNHSHGGDNINVKAALIHVIGDFLQSIGVFVAALVIYFKPDLGIMDPICTFLFSILVLVTTITILKDVLTVLMEGIPKGIDFSKVTETFMSVEGVVKVHDLRIWCLSMDKVALAAHVVINPGANAQNVLKETSQLIRSKYSFYEMTLQIEEFREDMEECSQCQGSYE